jgi:hypothetical protein
MSIRSRPTFLVRPCLILVWAGLAAGSCFGAPETAKENARGDSGAAAREPDVPPRLALPEISGEELVRRVEAALVRYEQGYLALETETVEDLNAPARRKDPSKKEKLSTVENRYCLLADGHRWRYAGHGYYDERSGRPCLDGRYLRMLRGTGGYDGKLSYVATAPYTYVREPAAFGGYEPVADTFAAPSPGRVTIGRHPGFGQPKPRYELFRAHGKNLTRFQVLARLGKAEVKRTRVSGVPCYAAEFTETGVTNTAHFAPQYGYLPLLATRRFSDRQANRFELRGVHKSESGLWMPKQVVRTRWQWIDKHTKQVLASRATTTVLAFEQREAWPDELFRLEIPFGVTVRDRVHDISYDNDPWWPKLAPWLRDRFDWPRPGLQQPWHTEISVGGVSGTPARDIQAVEWINGEPGPWTRPSRTVTLLWFGSVGTLRHRSWLAKAQQALKRYGPLGLDVVAVVPNCDREAIRPWVSEVGVSFPVAVDQPGEKRRGGRSSAGKTFADYGVSDVSAVLLVDHEKKVRPVSWLIAPEVAESRRPSRKIDNPLDGLDLAEAIEHTLKRAGISKEKIDGLGDELLPGELEEVRGRWLELLEKEPARSPVTGRVSEGVQPLPTATITLMPIFKLPGDPDYARMRMLEAPEQVRESRAGADGTFRVDGVPKGTYLLSASAPGRATFVSLVVVTEADRTEVNAALDQADGISGRVLDADGKPLSGVEILVRYHSAPVRWWDGCRQKVAPVMTDNAGRFQFTGLQQGTFTLAAKIQGFRGGKTAAVAGNSRDVVFRLEKIRR